MQAVRAPAAPHRNAAPAPAGVASLHSYSTLPTLA